MAFIFLRGQIEFMCSVHLLKSQVNELKQFQFNSPILTRTSSHQKAHTGTLHSCVFAHPMPDPQGSQSVWRKQRCSKLLFTHDLIARGRMLQPVVSLSWTPAVCTCEESNGLPAPSGHCQGGCEILCPLPCFPNWLEYAGQAPGRVYYILSGLRVMDPFQVQK